MAWADERNSHHRQCFKAGPCAPGNEETVTSPNLPFPFHRLQLPGRTAQDPKHNKGPPTSLLTFAFSLLHQRLTISTNRRSCDVQASEEFLNASIRQLSSRTVQMNKYGRLLPDEGDNLRETGPAVSVSSPYNMSLLAPFAEMNL